MTFFAGSQQPEHPPEEDGDDDGLGYYADGVKRTLTDDDIAYMRRREIEHILRDRALGKQNLESPSDIDNASGVCAATPEAHNGRRALGSPTAQSRVLKRKQKKKRKNKRKRDAESPKSSSGEEVTYRRIARELDEQKDTAVDLDY